MISAGTQALLFAIYMNDFDEGGVINKLALGLTIGGVVDGEEGFLRIQWNIDQLASWTELLI